jgi:hypothetical protein
MTPPQIAPYTYVFRDVPNGTYTVVVKDGEIVEMEPADKPTQQIYPSAGVPAGDKDILRRITHGR